MSEPQGQPITTKAQQAHTSACPHLEAVGTRWGDPVSEERQAELQAYLDRWEAEPGHDAHNGPFEGVALTGADVSWLAEKSGHDRLGRAPNLHLEAADLRSAHLEGANLGLAHLEKADLSFGHLERAYLDGTHLEGANLNDANLEDARLQQAHLQGTDFTRANLRGADLRLAFFDEASLLREVQFDRVSVADVRWNAVNLFGINWNSVRRLGDEPERLLAYVQSYQDAVRAYRQLASALASQGFDEQADRFGYRAQVLQRKVLLREAHFSSWLFSWLLWLISGYGYRPFRLLIAYAWVLAVYASIYYLLSRQGILFGPLLSWSEAAVLSIQVVIGHGLPGNLGLLDPINLVADSEVVVSVTIGLVLANAVGRRYFGR